MIFKDVINLLEQMGYQRVPSNVPELYLFQRREELHNDYVLVIDTSMRGTHNARSIQGVILQVGMKVRQRDPECEILSILIADQVLEVRELAAMEESIWFVDKQQQKLILYENQRESYSQLRVRLEQLFEHYYEIRVKDQSILSDEGGALGKNQTRVRVRDYIKKLPICCSLIVLVNILVFFGMELFLDANQESMVYDQLGIAWMSFLNQGEYYRVFTYMFLHSGVDHLVNNMLVLFFVGQSLERVISKVKFLAIYLASGIVAGVVSMGYNMIKHQRVLSVGASGAIFGIVGAMLYVVIRNRGKVEEISTRQLVLFIAFSLYGGFATSNVDNIAHIGGFLAGFLLAMILVRRKSQKEREEL